MSKKIVKNFFVYPKQKWQKNVNYKKKAVFFVIFSLWFWILKFKFFWHFWFFRKKNFFDNKLHQKNSQNNFWYVLPINDKKINFRKKNQNFCHFLLKFWFFKIEFFCHFWFFRKKICQKIRIDPKNGRAKFFLIMPKIES